MFGSEDEIARLSIAYKIEPSGRIKLGRIPMIDKLIILKLVTKKAAAIVPCRAALLILVPPPPFCISLEYDKYKKQKIHK